MATVQGHCDPRFTAVKAALQTHLSSGAELGASIHVDIAGTPVVDIWGGHADRAHTRPWTDRTIANIWSSTKAVTALAALVLISRGQLDPHERVATYWPEFAAAGKEDVLVRHLLSHSAGLPDWDRELSSEEKYDIPFAAGLLAAQKPRWTPGEAFGYHMVTMGHLVGELVRRITGKTLKQFVDDEIAGPLGADVQIGAREEDWGRCAEMVAPPMPPMPPPSAAPAAAAQPKPEDGEKAAAEGEAKEAPPKKPMPPPPSALVDKSNTPAWRLAELGAANGHSTAAGLARALSAVTLGGTANDVPLLTPSTIDLVFEEQAHGKCLVTGLPMRLGVGFGLTGGDTFAAWFPEQEGRIAFWGGWGGSIVIMDLERRMTVAYVMNKMEMTVLGNERTKEYVRAVYEAVKATE